MASDAKRRNDAASMTEGYEIDTLNTEQALAQTHERLRKGQVTLYEAAFAVDNLFIRADILILLETLSLPPLPQYRCGGFYILPLSKIMGG